MNCRNEFHMKKNVMNNSLTIEHSGHPNNFLVVLRVLMAADYWMAAVV